MIEHRHTFPRSHRIRTRKEFSGVFQEGVRGSRGPLTLYGVPNTMGHPRLGLAVGRSVGTAVRRNRIKRLLREGFRHLQHDLPGSYDLVILVRPHEPLDGPRYRELLMSLARQVDAAWRKRKATP